MIPVSEPLLAGRELELVTDCVSKGWISSQGPYIAQFEQAWAGYCGTKHGIAVSSGTAALQIAVDALHLGPGDEVVMPSFTIISCALAVVRAGAVPVVVDCDPATYCIDVQQAAAAITPRTRAIMPVHMYGHPADMDPLWQLAEKHGLAIIEDAAQAHGAEYLTRSGAEDRTRSGADDRTRSGADDRTWKRCGGLGTLAAFSFFANKLITTGEGGMVLTNSDSLAERCRSLRNLAFQKERFHHEELGYNFRMTNLQAAVGVAQVERIDEILARKRGIAAAYDRLLAGVAGIKLPEQMDWARSNYWMYAIVLSDDVGMDAFEFARRLAQKGVDTRPFFKGMHEQPALRALGLFQGLSLPVTERLYRYGLYLPTGMTLTEAQIETVAAAVKDVLAERRLRRG